MDIIKNICTEDYIYNYTSSLYQQYIVNYYIDWRLDEILIREIEEFNFIYETSDENKILFLQTICMCK